MTTRGIAEGDLYQGVDEVITYTLTTTAVGSSPTSPSVKAFDVNDSYEDVTSTVFPTNSPTVSGDIITLSPLRALTIHKVYRIEVQYTVSGGAPVETYFNVIAER